MGRPEALAPSSPFAGRFSRGANPSEASPENRRTVPVLAGIGGAYPRLKVEFGTTDGAYEVAL